MIKKEGNVRRWCKISGLYFFMLILYTYYYSTCRILTGSVAHWSPQFPISCSHWQRFCIFKAAHLMFLYPFSQIHKVCQCQPLFISAYFTFDTLSGLLEESDNISKRYVIKFSKQYFFIISSKKCRLSLFDREYKYYFRFYFRLDLLFVYAPVHGILRMFL